VGDKVAMTGDDFLLEFGIHFGRKTTMRATEGGTARWRDTLRGMVQANTSDISLKNFSYRASSVVNPCRLGRYVFVGAIPPPVVKFR